MEQDVEVLNTKLLQTFVKKSKFHNTRKLSSGFANNKGADQPAHPAGMRFSTFVIHFLENFNLLAASFCSCTDWFESLFVGNPEHRFCRMKAHFS